MYTFAMVPSNQLVLVEDLREIAWSHRSFVQGLASAKSLVVDLIRRSHYWIYDLATRTLSPSKFSGYAGMSFDRYQAARQGNSTGNKFDGGVAQRAIAAVLGDYQQDRALAHELKDWATATFGEHVLDGIDTRKWRFVRLPAAGVGGLAALAGGWEGSDELVDALRDVRRPEGRRAPELE